MYLLLGLSSLYRQNSRTFWNIVMLLLYILKTD